MSSFFRARAAHRAALLGAGLLLLSCSAILGIEDRELRSGGGAGGQAASGGAGASMGGTGPGGVGATGAGGPISIDPTCDQPADGCDQCFCDYCADRFADCESSGADCLAVVDCVSSAGCFDPMSCDSDCRSVAEQAGDPTFAGDLGACLATCSSACSGTVNQCVDLAITGNPSATGCWSCACTECEGLQALADCRDIYDCNNLAGCIAQTGCLDTAECESMCGYGIDPGLGDAGVRELSECINMRCPGAGCDAISTFVDPYDASMCTSRYDDGTDYPYCMECACSSCSQATVSYCSQGNVDCEAAVRCMTMAGCSTYPECTGPDRCADVFGRHLFDETVVNDLGMCATSCGNCQDFAISNDVRDRCADQYRDLSCAPCMCNNCPEDLIRQCVEQADCRQAWECMQTSGCSGTECVMQCSTPMLPAAEIDQLVQCAMNDCMTCSLAKGPGGPGGLEICNLRDDDGNGSVDEGFTWSFGSTFSVVGRADDITDFQVRPIPGRDEVAVGILEGPTGTPFFAIVTADGGVQVSPTGPAPRGSSFALGADSTLAGMISLDAGCPASCAGLVRADTASYALAGPDSFDFMFPAAQLFDAATYTSWWTTAALSDTGELVFSWLDQQGTPVAGTDVTFSGPWGVRGALAQRDWWAVAVVERVLPPSLEVFTVDLSVYTAEGPNPVGLPLAAASGLALGQPLALANPPPGMTESPVAVFYGGGGQSSLARIDPAAGGIDYGPRDTPGATPLSVVNVGGNFVTLAADGAELSVDRFTETLDQPYAELSPTYYSSPFPGGLHRLVSVGTRLLLFTAMGPELLLTEIGCNPP